MTSRRRRSGLESAAGRSSGADIAGVAANNNNNNNTDRDNINSNRNQQLTSPVSSSSTEEGRGNSTLDVRAAAILAGSGTRKRKVGMEGQQVQLEEQDGAREQVVRKAERLVLWLQSVTAPLENVMLIRKQVKVLLELCKREDHLDDVAASGAIGMIVQVLKMVNGGGTAAVSVPTVSGVEELERDITFILGLMAIKVEHQQKICDAEALPTLVGIITRYSKYDRKDLTGVGAQTCRRAADAVTNLAHENNSVKNMVRLENGIPPLVYLLESLEPKVQRAVAGTLRTLAFKNEENKDVIVDLNALPLLIQMLRADDTSIHYEAVGVIGNLVHSSQHIKVRVLEEGALQPVIDLLSSPCADSQREAALLLGQFATVEADYKCKIVQRGAVPPLITMLASHDTQLKEMAAFALGRLAQHTDNQAGIVAMGGLKPLLDLLGSEQSNLQHNAAFALYGLSENEDNLLHFVREGAVQRIQSCVLGPQASRDCVQKMTKRLQDKLDGHVMGQLLYILQVSKFEKKTIAVGLGLLCTSEQSTPDPIIVCNSLVKKKVPQILADIVSDGGSTVTLQEEAARALANIAKFSGAAKQENVESLQPPEPNVHLGDKYVNDKNLSDVTFVVEGKNFYAHRIALLESSDVFKSMFDGNYKEKQASSIPIPNIRWPVFEAMMHCIYTGSVEVKPELAQELLGAADQYMLENLKRLCEAAIAVHLSPENVFAAFDLSDAYDAPELAKSCTMYCLENFSSMTKHPLEFVPKMKKMTNRLVQAIESHIEEQMSSNEEPMEE